MIAPIMVAKARALLLGGTGRGCFPCALRASFSNCLSSPPTNTSRAGTNSSLATTCLLVGLFLPPLRLLRLDSFLSILNPQFVLFVLVNRPVYPYRVSLVLITGWGGTLLNKIRLFLCF